MRKAARTYRVHGLVLGTLIALTSLSLRATPGFWEAATQADFLRG
jgi:hypothetical protein